MAKKNIRHDVFVKVDNLKIKLKRASVNLTKIRVKLKRVTVNLQKVKQNEHVIDVTPVIKKQSKQEQCYFTMRQLRCREAISVNQVPINPHPSDLVFHLKIGRPNHLGIVNGRPRTGRRLKSSAIKMGNISVVENNILDQLSAGTIISCVQTLIYSKEAYVNYELGSQKSIEADNEDCPTKQIPFWAQEEQLFKSIIVQDENDIDPSSIFATCESPNLEGIFPFTSATKRNLWLVDESDPEISFQT